MLFAIKRIIRKLNPNENLFDGFTLDAKLVSSITHLIQMHLNFTPVDKVFFVKYKLSIIFRGKIIYVYYKRDCSPQKLNQSEAFGLEKSFLHFRIYFLVTFNSKGFNPERHAYAYAALKKANMKTNKQTIQNKKQATSSSLFPQNGSTTRFSAKKWP